MKSLPYLPTGHPKHFLDLYTPDASNYPTLVFIHGGGWMDGDKERYPHWGEWLAQHGIGCALLNYRLTPEVKHPDHCKDAAAGLAWVYRNISDHGGDPSKIILCGYSSGGHIAACIGMDPDFLKDHGLSLNIIKGMVCISGVYLINFTLDIAGYGHVFPRHHRHRGSPINHCRPDLPPFMVVYATDEYITLDRQAMNFHDRLIEKGCQSKLFLIEAEHQFVTEAMCQEGNKVGQEFLEFIAGACQ